MNPDDRLGTIRLVIPVKAFHLAKSRLTLSDRQRARVARDLFTNTLDVALQCLPSDHVIVMTSSPHVRKTAERRRAHVLPDLADELNQSLAAALTASRAFFPGATLAVMVADLPRLTPPVLTRALLEASGSRRPRIVVDRHGTGTTFVSIPPRSDLPMLFGPGSARRFIEAGSEPLLFPPPEITHDLDVMADLDAAIATK